jgi:undecaprenyl diphosphate synthase
MLNSALKKGPSNYPKHVAIIMDGNGRWAKARGLPRTAGHKKGAETTQTIVTACRDLGVEYLTLYAFSSENWQRPQDEINDLMQLLSFYIRKELKQLLKNGVVLRVIGDKNKLPAAIKTQIIEAEEATKGNKGLVLQVALSYGSRQEITQAVKQLASDIETGTVISGDVNEELLDSYLSTAGIPDPDLLIRTGGEYRISNFLLWQMAYTELFFTARMWPDFNRDDLVEALENFSTRERRYGTA